VIVIVDELFYVIRDDFRLENMIELECLIGKSVKQKEKRNNDDSHKRRHDKKRADPVFSDYSPQPVMQGFQGDVKHHREKKRPYEITEYPDHNRDDNEKEDDKRDTESSITPDRTY